MKISNRYLVSCRSCAKILNGIYSRWSCWHCYWYGRRFWLWRYWPYWIWYVGYGGSNSWTFSNLLYFVSWHSLWCGRLQLSIIVEPIFTPSGRKSTRCCFMEYGASECSAWFQIDPKWSRVSLMLVQDQFSIFQNLQMSPSPQTSTLVWTFYHFFCRFLQQIGSRINVQLFPEKLEFQK